MQGRTSSRAKVTLLAIGSLMLVAIPLANATNQEKPTYKATGNEASIAGTISFIGVPPEPLHIDTSADAICEMASPDTTTEFVIVTNDKLANVIVSVRGEPLNEYSFEALSPDVTLEHKGCRYVPHVLGMQTQQTLKILNSDLTSHNTHPTPRNNVEWNITQPAGTVAIEERFARPEFPIPVRDNHHPWEKAYLGVFSHPFFSVSSADGSYKISGLPPGQYTVSAWHEKLGEQTLDVFVAGGEQRNLDFTFKASGQ